MKQAGISDIGIVVGETRDEIKTAVGNGDLWDVNVTYIEQEAPLGLAHAVKIAKPFLDDDNFVMFLGDNLIKNGIVSLVKEFDSRRPNAQILLAKVKDPARFGVAELSDGQVVKLTEKPKEPKSDLALVGVYMFDKNIWEAVAGIEPSWRDELEITDAIQYLIDKGLNVEPHIIDGWWKDTGKLEDMLEANRIILETMDTRIDGYVDDATQLDGHVVVEKGAHITNSHIRGPAIIGENSQIVDSFIGPFTSVYYDSLIKQSEVEHCIILEKSRVVGISRLEDSLIGKNVIVERSEKKPKAYRLMLGDNSQVGVF